MARPIGQFNKYKKDLFRLLQYLNSMGIPCCATNEYLAKKIGKSVRQVKRYLAELRKEEKITSTSKVYFSKNTEIRVGFYEKRQITCAFILNRVKVLHRPKFEPIEINLRMPQPIPLNPDPNSELEDKKIKIEEPMKKVYGYKEHQANIKQAKDQYVKNATKDMTWEQIEEFKKYNYNTDAWVDAILYKFSAASTFEENTQWFYNFWNRDEIAAQKAKEEAEAKEKELSYEVSPEDQAAWDKIMEEGMRRRAAGEFDELDRQLDEMKARGEL
jgi:Helix-turn-helix domain